jgi:hypothetical protein
MVFWLSTTGQPAAVVSFLPFMRCAPESEIVGKVGHDVDVAIPGVLFLDKTLNDASNHDGLL